MSKFKDRETRFTSRMEFFVWDEESRKKEEKKESNDQLKKASEDADSLFDEISRL